MKWSVPLFAGHQALACRRCHGSFFAARCLLFPSPPPLHIDTSTFARTDCHFSLLSDTGRKDGKVNSALSFFGERDAPDEFVYPAFFYCSLFNAIESFQYHARTCFEILHILIFLISPINFKISYVRILSTFKKSLTQFRFRTRCQVYDWFFILRAKSYS